MAEFKVNGVDNIFVSGSQPLKQKDDVDIVIFDGQNPNPINSTDIELQEIPEFSIAMDFKVILNNDELFDEDVLLVLLDEIKDYDLVSILKNFRVNNEGLGLLDTIMNNSKISNSTKNKFENYFKEKLSEIYGFDKNYSKKGDKTISEIGDYKYESGSYNIIQKDDDILEVENLETHEKRIIDFKEIVPELLNGIDDIVEIKSSIQKLPGEILFQIPKEVSVMIAKSVVQDSMVATDDTENMNFITRNDGLFAYIEEIDKDYILTTGDSSTIIHELAHAIFFNDKGEDVLLNNPKIVEGYNMAIENLKKDDKKPFDVTDENSLSEDYWSMNISELGAEIVTAIFEKDYYSLESIKKYVPTETISLVMETFKERLNAFDKHKSYTKEEFLEYLENIE